KGQPVADPVTGIWMLTVTGLSVAAHSFTAKAMYGTGQSSEPRTLTVTALVKPTISSIKDSKNIEIPPGGSTSDTRVTLTGEASKGQSISVLDNTSPLSDAVADTVTGIWAYTATDLPKGLHTYIARARYGLEAESAPRSLTVSTFNVDPSEMILNGIKLIPAGNYGLQAKEVAGNTGTRVPTGGVPPYTYKSSHPELASVDINGKVTGLKNGTATITITDNKKNSTSYKVRVSRVYTLLLNNSYMSGQSAIAWLRSVGATPLDLNGRPLGWEVQKLNFINWTAIYIGPLYEQSRWVAESSASGDLWIMSSTNAPDTSNGHVVLPFPRNFSALAYILRK
ncbi:Ig-like domain-containing protein, partial [Pseudomonas sp. WC2]|uniref:Ig-like domain-containing protein n=1 Tax=Pseudomonas sp. WC2 TaxID=3424773 RepID=UPI003D34C644